jgi:RNA polymerase sigma-70 factor (ECF subfamily)
MSASATEAIDPVGLKDGELARLIAGGGAGMPVVEAEGELCRRFAPRIRLFGLRHLGDEFRSADLVQRVLITAIQQLRRGRVREPDRVASFVLGVARLTVKDMVNGDRRETPTAPETLSLLAEGATSTGYGALEQDRLAGCVQGLSDRERTVVLLSFFQGDTSQRIARTLNLTEVNVRVIRYRALLRLRTCMDAGGEEAR